MTPGNVTSDDRPFYDRSHAYDDSEHGMDHNSYDDNWSDLLAQISVPIDMPSGGGSGQWTDYNGLVDLGNGVPSSHQEAGAYDTHHPLHTPPALDAGQYGDLLGGGGGDDYGGLDLLLDPMSSLFSNGHGGGMDSYLDSNLMDLGPGMMMGGGHNDTSMLNVDLFKEIERIQNIMSNITTELSSVTTKYEQCHLKPNYELLNTCKWWISGFLVTILSIIGIMGQTTSITVLTKMSQKTLFYRLLRSLCMADLTVVVFTFLETPPAWGPQTIGHVYRTVHPFINCISHAATSASVFLTLVVVMERYQAVCWPTQYLYRIRCYGERYLYYLYCVPAVSLAALFNIFKFVSVTQIGEQLEHNDTYASFLLYYQVFHPTLTTVIIPFAILPIANWRIYKRIMARRVRTVIASNRDMEINQTRTLFTAVILFLVFNMPRVILFGMEIQRLTMFSWCKSLGFVYTGTEVPKIFYMIGRLCIVINCNLNFFVYCATGPEFMKTFILLANGICFRLFGCKPCKPRGDHNHNSRARNSAPSFPSVLAAAADRQRSPPTTVTIEMVKLMPHGSGGGKTALAAATVVAETTTAADVAAVHNNGSGRSIADLDAKQEVTAVHTAELNSISESGRTIDSLANGHCRYFRCSTISNRMIDGDAGLLCDRMLRRHSLASSTLFATSPLRACDHNVTATPPVRQQRFGSVVFHQSSDRFSPRSNCRHSHPEGKLLSGGKIVAALARLQQLGGSRDLGLDKKEAPMTTEHQPPPPSPVTDLHLEINVIRGTDV